MKEDTMLVCSCELPMLERECAHCDAPCKKENCHRCKNLFNADYHV